MKLSKTLLFLLLFISCSKKSIEKVEKRTIHEQLTSLNKAANSLDIDKFMDHFLKSDSTLFVFNANPAFGWQNIKIRRLECWDTIDTAYYKIYNQHIIPLSDSVFTATNFATSWAITKEGTEKNGRFTISMTWIKTSEGWKIIEAHESAAGFDIK
ncbi:nuclear transport factor 2 family protein [Mangrovivirga cuniculi]|uniref:SnoaL-like domain-containing protein n=1 Tax=Mangrovivirga cuniculi TaxID=2715131 RepID=A0A4D7JQB6_9BACT|nr:nuclear transport factor 2 family protein [Mangrovivirga cuniculi]QCK15670.1 hypothetical protein DCC35_13415 [Mangrovivirga cuniculi]